MSAEPTKVENQPAGEAPAAATAEPATQPAAGADAPAEAKPATDAAAPAQETGAKDEQKEEPKTESKEEGPKETPLAKLAARLADIKEKAGHGEMWGVALSDLEHAPTAVVLQKYLRANDGDVAAAEKQLTAALEWRKKNNP
ncbi:hypothetical protein IMZ48_28535, partial [Candidatus Bathyarchaeota archaeon]|nr:hypothetical protein [Candidatus Bathyarchaeota archaeon]